MSAENDSGYDFARTMTTDFHAKYYAYDLTRQAPPGAADQLSMSLFDASVDLIAESRKPFHRGWTMVDVPPF